MYLHILSQYYYDHGILSADAVDNIQLNESLSHRLKSFTMARYAPFAPIVSASTLNSFNRSSKIYFHTLKNNILVCMYKINVAGIHIN